MGATPKSESRGRSSSVISISSGDDTPPSKRKRSLNTTPQPETPSKKLATSIDDMALTDGGLQFKSCSPEKSQVEQEGDVSFPSEETYRLKSAAIIRMLYADEGPVIPKNNTMGPKDILAVSAATPSARCYRNPDGKGYMSLSDNKDDEDPGEMDGYGKRSDSFFQLDASQAAPADASSSYSRRTRPTVATYNIKMLAGTSIHAPRKYLKNAAGTPMGPKTRPTIEKQPKIDMGKNMQGAPAEDSLGITLEAPNGISQPYKCGKCGSRWKDEAYLKYHLTKSRTSCNPNWDPSQAKPRGRPRIYNLSDLKCGQCGLQFRSEASYKYHITKSQTTCNPHWVSSWVSSQAETSGPLPMAELSASLVLEQPEYQSPYVNSRPSYGEYASQYDRQARLPTLAPKPVPPSPGPTIDLTLTPDVLGPTSNQNPIAPMLEPIQTQTVQSPADDSGQKSS